MSPRWRKVIADLWDNRTRTLLVVLSIAVGVFAVGMIGGSSVIMRSDLRAAYRATNPAGATIYTLETFDEDLVQTVRRMRAVDEADGRRTLTVRYEAAGGQWRTLQLVALRDYDDIRVGRIGRVSGAWPPPARELLLERSSLGVIRARVGEALHVELPDGRTRRMRIAGVVHDISQVSSFFANTTYGYITLDTLEWLGEPRAFNQLYLTEADRPSDKAHVETVARQVRDKVEKAGYTVTFLQVPDPYEHWSEDVGNAMFLLLTVLGLLSLLLSGFLIVNTISSLLAAQVRQIGIMKAIGARTRQITGIYLSTVLAFGVLALVIAIPLGIVGAQAFSAFTAGLLNFDIGGYRLPPGVLTQQVAAGLIVPLLSALYPVLGGTRITVREATTAYGLGGDIQRRSAADRLVDRVRGLSRPALLSLRNTFRRKGRLALTLGTLTLAGAIFIGVVSVRDSLLATLDDAFRYWSYDVGVEFSRSYRVEQLERAAQRVRGVVQVESWMFRSAVRMRPDGTESNTIVIVAMPPASPLIQPTVLEGRWLLPEDENAVVMNTDVRRAEPGITVGGDIVLKIGRRETRWRVVGLVRGVFSGPLLYANAPYLSHAIHDAGRGERVFVVTRRHDLAYTAALAESLEAEFRRLGLRISATQTTPDLRRAITAQFNVLVVFLLIMAILLAVVGGLGLAGTMSINVLERTREIGVLRAIGASDGAIRRIVLTEGVLIGLLSWGIGTVLAIPLGSVISAAVGRTMFGGPLTYRFSLGGMGLWLAVVVVLAAAASILPARSASRLTVREILAYE